LDKISYRRLTVFDVPTVSFMWSKMITEAGFSAVKVDIDEIQNYGICITEKINNRDHCVLVATLDGAVIGYTHGEIHETPYGRPRIHLFSHATYVLEKHRSRGVAIALTSKMEKDIREGASWEIGLTGFMCPYNEKAIKRWMDAGFTPDAVNMVRIENGNRTERN